MKNLPLAIQIWLVFAILVIGISIVLLLIIPISLDRFFTSEIYATIENAQLLFKTGETWRWLRDLPVLEGDETRQNIRMVRHVVLRNDHQIFPPNRLPAQFLNKALKQAESQKTDYQRYQEDIKGERMLYVIRRLEMSDSKTYLLSFMWDTYRRDLVGTLFKRLFWGMSLVFMLSWVPAIILARYLTRPLVVLEKHVSQIAKQDWKEPIHINRRDEIGLLAQSIESLRRRLIWQNELQQTFLQNISHSLKTPVMVIRSYAQSILDGIFPKDDLESSVLVIAEEAERLEKRNRDLLYLTKLDAISLPELARDDFYFDELIENMVERFKPRRKEIQWSLTLESILYIGDYEQWTVALENLFDNQVKYANTTINISLKRESSSHVSLRIGNDGPPIAPTTMKTLFEKFHPGVKGEFGLGLSIVTRIVKLHGGTITAANEEEGTAFYLRFPLEEIRNK